ncbi:MAG: ribosome silencing factor [Anaerohalosphaeraceae bacterium]
MAKTKTTSERKFAIEAARLANDRHCTDIVVLDLKGVSPATDFFVIATSTSDRQGKSVADEISDMAKEYDLKKFASAGYEQGRWILIDYINVVVHLFNSEMRSYYDLEMLWGDAKKVRWQPVKRTVTAKDKTKKES